MNDDRSYDVIIVGAGIAGALIAYRLSQAGKQVLILDSGPAVKTSSRVDYLEHFYLALAKTPESPYRVTPDAPNPLSLDLTAVGWKDNPKNYFIQKGPLPFSSTYERRAGGTTWHWMGTSLRLLPNDFKLKTTYDQGVDWPISYDDLEPWYCEAEREIGIAGNVEEQQYLGLFFSQPYPMPGILQSYQDQLLSKLIGEMDLYGQPVRVSPTPQARNSVSYDSRPVCAGNTNCIPICPIHAKYDATVHLRKAEILGAQIWPQTVVYSLNLDEETGRISGVNYRQYEKLDGPATHEGTVRANRYILAAHAIEAPKILLNSITPRFPNGLANRSDQVGRNLMDHPVQLSWAGSVSAGFAVN